MKKFKPSRLHGAACVSNLIVLFFRRNCRLGQVSKWDAVFVRTIKKISEVSVRKPKQEPGICRPLVGCVRSNGRNRSNNHLFLVFRELHVVVIAYRPALECAVLITLSLLGQIEPGQKVPKPEVVPWNVHAAASVLQRAQAVFRPAAVSINELLFRPRNRAGRAPTRPSEKRLPGWTGRAGRRAFAAARLDRAGRATRFCRCPVGPGGQGDAFLPLPGWTGRAGRVPGAHVVSFKGYTSTYLSYFITRQVNSGAVRFGHGQRSP